MREIVRNRNWKNIFEDYNLDSSLSITQGHDPNIFVKSKLYLKILQLFYQGPSWVCVESKLWGVKISWHCTFNAVRRNWMMLLPPGCSPRGLCARFCQPTALPLPAQGTESATKITPAEKNWLARIILTFFLYILLPTSKEWCTHNT